MVRTQAPLMPAAVEKRLPVGVFWAVKVTPGRGMFPLLTCPCSLPPDGASAGGLCTAGSLAAGALVAGWAAGVAGDWARAAKPPATKIPATTAHCMASRRIHAPRPF